MLGIAKTDPARKELARELRRGVAGEVSVARMMRGLFATDASLYQIEPAAVVFPRSAADVAHVLRVARERGLKILPRGGGTSLAGQAAGEGVVLDFSRHMRRILETNVEQRWVRVEPGAVRDELNAALAPTGLHFAPETATANRAAIGGMIANNSAGTRSIFYGRTIDHVLELKALLPTGEELHLRPTTADGWEATAARDDREGKIYRRLREIVLANRDEIARRYPKILRRVNGYALDAFLTDKPWNLGWLLLGSEGTLAVVTEAKLNLEPLPAERAVVVAHFHYLNEALRAVADVVRHEPSAVELLDRSVIELARGNVELRRMLDWVEGRPAAVLLIECVGASREEATAKMDKLVREMRSVGYGYAHPTVVDPHRQKEIWHVRASGLGILLGMKGDAKPLPFIEDSAVPVERLPDYIGDVVRVCESLGVRVALYAHASVGLIHVRPILNVKDPQDVERMKRISAEAFELVRKYGGSWSGEHGDGLVRSYKLREFFGDRLYEAFREIKGLFDPDGMMNPGKIVDAGPIEDNLRISPQYRALPIKTYYHYRGDGGFDRAVEMCSGVGACRKTLSGTMCPSYMATRDEVHTTRGRANALRLAMTGQLGPDAMTGRALYNALDLCLSCKGCKAECPSNVDMARLKADFLAGYRAKHGARTGDKFFARSAEIAPLIAGRFAGPVNRINRLKPVRKLMEKTLGIDARRPLPPFAEEPFPRWFAARPRAFDPSRRQRRRVALFDDTFMNFHEPSIGRAAARVLERLGYEVELARAGCCCRTLISKGFLKEARERGTEVMRRLHRFALDRVPVVGCEPSCVSALTDDLPDLIENAQLGRTVAENVTMLEDFLAREIEEGRIAREDLAEACEDATGARFAIHGHCHQKALYGTRAMKTVLGCIPGARVEEIDSGCCGMAGSFGYEREHYDISMRIGERRLFPAVRELPEGTRLIADGFSCRHQIADGADARARHFIEALAEAMGMRE